MALPRRRALSVVVALLGLSCLSGPKAPVVAPSGTLAAAGEAAGPASDGPFRVVFASPKGKTTDAADVNIVFSRAMRPLDLVGDETTPPATLTAEGGGAAPKGAWRWMGTAALSFAPSAPLARATKYRVTVPAGTRALDGAALATPYTFDFSTPPPTIVQTFPGRGHRSLKPSQPIEVLFDQPVALAEIEKRVTFVLGEDKKSKRIAVRATYPKADVHARVLVTPKSALPLDTEFTLAFDPELRGEEGPLPMGALTKPLTFQTYGPLAVTAVECYRDTPSKRCDAHEGLRLELSQRVRIRDVIKVVSVDGATLAWGNTVSARGDDDWTSVVHLPAKLQPARSYRVNVAAGLKDEFGQTLAAPRTITIDTDDEWPNIEVGVVGTVFDAAKKAPPAIPMATVNVKEVDVAAAAFDEASYTAWYFAQENRSTLDGLARTAGAKTKTITSTAPKNTRHQSAIDLAGMLGRPVDRGLFAFGVRGPARRGTFDQVRTLAATDLGISAKMSRFGSLVWVTSLTSGKPIAGAVVSVRRRDASEAFSGTTDKDGLVTIPADRYDPSPKRDDEQREDALVFARLGNDLSVRRAHDMLSPWRFANDVDPAGRMAPVGFVFTDRGVYRPGETIRAKGLFRSPTPRGTTTPVGRDVQIAGFDPQGEEVFKATARLGEFGEFAVDVPIPASAKLGSFEVRAELDKHTAESGVARAHAELAAYKASEFKVAVEPDRPSYVRGDRATFTTRGDYLFGAPMKGGKVRFTARRTTGYFALPLGDDDARAAFVWDDDTYFRDKPDSPARSSLYANVDGELNAKGELPTPLTLNGPEQRGTELVHVEADVEDLTRQTVAAEASAIVHPGEFYVVMARPGDGFVEEGARLTPKVMAVEPSGKKRAGVNVNVELVRRSWSTIARGAGESSVTHETRVVDEVVERCAVSTRAEGPQGCALTTKAAGYHVVRATARDARGNVIGASTSQYVLATKEGSMPTWPTTDVSTVELTADKTSYEIGDVATVLVKNPYPEAEALVTIERAGVYKTERKTLRGATPTLRIPITDEMKPNAFVGVHLLRGRTKDRPAKGPDVGAPSFRLGYAQLAVKSDDRRLKVVVTPNQKELRPGQEVEVDVAVTDRRGNPVRANATLYAVDEGVLMLTGYKTPDPLPTFAAPRPLAVFTLESRDDLARIFRLSPAGPGEDKGAEGGGGGEGNVRADFRATAHFEPSLLVDRGRAKTRFRLPDSLTTFRIMAVVADPGERFGFGEAQVVTSRRLMLRPALPRFFRAGDDVDAGVIVSTKGLPQTDVKVIAEVQGMALEGANAQNVQIAPSGQAELRFRFKPTQAGNAVLTFRAQAGSETDALKLTKKIDIPTSMEAVALGGETEQAAAERLGDLRALRSDVGGLEVALSSSALVGLDGAVKQVLEYPYGCTEQLTSRLVPLVFAADLLPYVGAPAPPDAKRVIADTIGKILKAQRPDGWFAYWSDSPQADHFLTAYVTWALTEAKKRGHVVPQSAIDTATAALQKSTRRSIDDRLDLARSAFIADVLASIGTADGGLMTELYEKRAQLPLFARAMLAHAYAVAPMSKLVSRETVFKELLRDLEAHVRITPTGATIATNVGSAYAPLLDSDARTTALVLRALLAGDAKHPLVTKLARGLASGRKGGAFRNTQEAAFGLLALDEFRRVHENGALDFDARVFLGEELLREHHFQAPGSFLVNVPASKLSTSSAGLVTFQALGQGHLYYEARLRYARVDMPTTPLERGFFVNKTMRSVKPEALDEALRTQAKASDKRFGAGDLVLIDVHLVATSPREQVVLDDPLPAGFEAMDARLATTSSIARRAAQVENEAGDEGDDEDAQDARAGGRGELHAPFHREVRDDRVLTFVEHMPAGMFHYRYLARATSRGAYVVPPTRAECMYEPEVFGRTAAQVVEVR